VQDDGPGIAPAAQPHLFTRFYQAERDTPGRPATQGLGLGLYITREIVAAHGGTVAVASAPGAGATFTVRLPLLAPEGDGVATGTGSPSDGADDPGDTDAG
jgi:signal transduction histidine kinase